MNRRELLVAGVGALASLAAPGASARCPAPLPAPALVAPAIPRGMRIGLALGSGSMHGYAHLGVLQEIEASKLPVEVVAGTSVGALVGALWASGMDAPAIAALARRENLGELSHLARSWQGLFTSEPMRAPLEAAFRGRPMEKWPRRFGAVATNVATGERRLLARGDAATAVLASSAVPVLYRPVMVGGERLADGALVEPVPVQAARDLGATFVIAVDVAYRPFEEEADGLAGYAFQAMHILVNSLSALQLASADVALRLNLHRHLVECGREALVEAGRDAMRRAWPELHGALLKARGSPAAPASRPAPARR